MIERSRITGLVLAGGRGVRMGAVDKGLEPFDGRPLVAHAIARLANQVGPIVLSANQHRDVYESFGHPVVADRIDGHAGPLAGIDAALAGCATDFLVVVPCDAPFFPLDLVAQLANAFTLKVNEGPADRADIEAAVACTSVRTHPVFCMVRRATSAALTAYLEAGRRSVAGWLASLQSREVSFADEEAFRNLNTPQDLHDAQVRRDR
jgi:molybdopterin-guanine dinucleotide biosynthesis protein A